MDSKASTHVVAETDPLIEEVDGSLYESLRSLSDVTTVESEF